MKIDDLKDALKNDYLLNFKGDFVILIGSLEKIKDAYLWSPSQNRNYEVFNFDELSFLQYEQLTEAQKFYFDTQHYYTTPYNRNRIAYILNVNNFKRDFAKFHRMSIGLYTDMYDLGVFDLELDTNFCNKITVDVKPEYEKVFKQHQILANLVSNYGHRTNFGKIKDYPK